MQTEVHVPRVSIVIATFNRGPRIRDTVASAIDQSSIPAEVVVVDDGSTDDTAAYAADVSSLVRVVRQSNAGPSAARNLGARIAEAPNLIFLDHDDLLLPNAVRTLAALSQDFPEAAAWFADHRYHDLVSGTVLDNHHTAIPAFERLKNLTPIRQGSRGSLYGRALYSALLRGNLLQQPWMIRREVFDELGGFRSDVRYCEDWNLYLKLTWMHKIALTDEVISTHQVEGTNLHLEGWEKQHAMYERTLLEQLERLPLTAVGDQTEVRKRIGGLHKFKADQLYKEGKAAHSWRAYLTSARWWPCDHVVLARTVLRLPAFTR